MGIALFSLSAETSGLDWFSFKLELQRKEGMPLQKSCEFADKSVSCMGCGLYNQCIPRGFNQRETLQIDKVIDHKHHCKRNDYLIRSGDPMEAVYAVRTGSFKLITSDAEGTEQVLGFYFPGDLIGLEGFATQIHSCSVIALENASVCRLSCANLDVYSEKISSLRRELTQLLASEMTSRHDMLLALGKMSAEEKLAVFLVKLSSNFSRRGFSATEFNLSMSRLDIADYLGITIETVSRLLARLQEEKLIAVERRNIRILDLASLRSMAHETMVAKEHLSQETAATPAMLRLVR